MLGLFFAAYLSDIFGHLYESIRIFRGVYRRTFNHFFPFLNECST